MFMWLWLIDDLWLLLRSIEKPNTNELLVRDPYHPYFFRIVVEGVSVARGHTDPPRYYRHLPSALPQHLSVVCATENQTVSVRVSFCLLCPRVHPLARPQSLVPPMRRQPLSL